MPLLFAAPRLLTTTCLLLLSLLTVPARAQTDVGSIQGKVVDAQGQPIVGVNAALLGTTFGNATSEEGTYEIKNLPPGDYTLVFSAVGYERRQQTISVAAGQTTRADATLLASTTELQGVEVTGRKQTSYKNDDTFIGTKTETALKDVPQAISYVTKEVIQDQQAFRTGDVVKNISGVNQFSGYDDFTLRGFRSSTQLFNGLRYPGNFWTMPLLSNIERVEVIKGPASALFANADPGGTINRVTKKPLDESRQSLSIATGTFDTYRAQADFTGPVNESKNLLYRLNLGYQNAGSFRTLQENNALLIAPSISFLPTDKTRVNVDLVYANSRGKLDRGQPIFGATAGTDLNTTPISFSLNQTGDYLNEDFLTLTGSLQHQFSDKISFNASYLKFGANEDLFEHRTSNRYAVDGAGQEIPTQMEMQTIRRLRKVYSDNLTSYFVFDVATGPLRHKLLAGYDYIQSILPQGGSQQTAGGYRNAANTGAITGRYNPANRSRYLLDAQGNPVPNVPHFNLENPNYSIANTNTYFLQSAPINPEKYYVNGIYLQDQIQWGRAQLLLGLRQEFYTSWLNYRKDTGDRRVKQEALIPRVGLVFALTDQVNAYGTYVQGYQPQVAATIGSPDIFGGPFDPLTSVMWEGGLKGEFLNKRLAASVAAYQIEQNNVLVNARNPDNPELLEQRGQERARGVELDVLGRITPDWSITANYAFNRTIISQSTNEAEVGRTKENAPRHAGGLWTKYTLSEGALSGLGVGLGANFVTRRNTFSPLLTLPGYSIFDAAIYYRIDKFQLALNANNLLNKTHWVGGYDYNRLYPGAPRNLLASVGYTF